MIYLHPKVYVFRVCRITALRRLSRIAGVLLALFSAPSVHGATEVVVAVRYMQEEGTSHAHLYLHGESGRLIRQLTNDDAYQDSDPFFSPDGNTIVFTRESAGKSEVWSIDPRGAGLQQLPEAPDWYKQAAGSHAATDSDSLGKPVPKSDAYQGADGLAHYRLPDGSAELVVQESKDTQNPGETYFLKDLKAGTQVQIASESGSVFGLLPVNTVQQSYFLIEPPLNLAFILERLNSTDGSEVLALDLKTHEIRELSRPPGEREKSPPPPIEVDPAAPMAGEGAFLAITKVRFVPFGSGKKTANSSYLERYDHQLHVIRYAHDGAALFYGASVYRMGKKPQAIWIPRIASDLQAPPELAAGAPSSTGTPGNPPNGNGNLQGSGGASPSPDVHDTAEPVAQPIPMDGGVWMYNKTLKGWTWADIDGWQYFAGKWIWNGEGPAPSKHPATPHPPAGGFPNPPQPGAGGPPSSDATPPDSTGAVTGTSGIVLYTPGALQSSTAAPIPDVHYTAEPVAHPIPMDGGAWMYNKTLKGWTWADIDGWQYFAGKWIWNGEGPAPAKHPATPHPPAGGFPNPPQPGAGGPPSGTGGETGTSGIVLYTPGASLSGTGNLQGNGGASPDSGSATSGTGTGGIVLYTPGASLSGTGNLQGNGGASPDAAGASSGTSGIVLYTPGTSLSGTGDLSGTGGTSLYTPGASLYTPGASLSGTGTSLYTPGKSLYTAGIALTPGVEVKETPKIVRINLRGDILFDFDKWDIRPSAETTLSQIAKLILKYPKAAVQIDGYTDSKGSATYNLGLSDRRSGSVKAWLASRGVPENIVSTRGWGAEHPVAPNKHPNGSDDPEGRQKNRRVEITIHK